ncbi:MAG: prolipoprotein diacylglyceryl transferase [Nocardioidaceae bacterium]|nr:prolipoprotein diacylglyceryl transferase [Nocardioidaceae bacterium]
MMPFFIPSPSQGVWDIGPIPIRAYALCIITGAIVAIWIGEKRWTNRGGREGMISDIALWAIPFGIVGARLYHVMTDPELYFGSGKSPIRALYIWEGGLGIWGAIALGAVGAAIGCRRKGATFGAVADALAPGILVAQAIGRFGNYFNQELFGRPTTKPWGLEIDLAHRPTGYEQYATFHPTFLYESIWNLLGALAIFWIGRRMAFGYGRVFALYVMVYTAGRFWIETVRIDPANDIGPFRVNVWVSIIVFAGAAAYFVIVGRRTKGRGDVDISEGKPDSQESDLLM